MSICEQEHHIRSDERPRTFMELIQRVGAKGKYQKRLLFVLGLSWFVAGIILLSTAFLFRSPALDCQAHGLLVSDRQCQQYVCSLREEQWQQYLSADNHFHSLATSGNYLCENSVTISLVSSCTYIGAFVGYIVVSFFADNYGRRKALLGAWAICAVGTVVVASSISLQVAAVGFFLSGFGSDAAINLTLVFFAQVVGGLKRQKYSIIVQVFFAGGALVVTFFFYLFQHWRVVWCLLVAAPAVIQLMLVHCYIQETPQFLLHAGVSEAVAALNRIGKINLDRKQTLEEEDLQNVADYQLVAEFKNKIITPLDLCRFSSVRGATVACSVLAFVTYAMYYGPALIMDEVGQNIFLSSALIQLSQILAYIPAFIYIQRLHRRKSGIILFSVAAVLSFILVMVEKPQDCNQCYHQIVELVVAFFFRSCVTFFFCIFQVYMCELFPARIRGMGMGIASSFGTIAAVLNPYYLQLVRSKGLNAFSLFLMMAVTAITCLALLPQTWGKPLAEEILEMQGQKERRRSVVTMRSPKIRRRDHKSQITYDMLRSKNSRMIQSNRLD